MPSTWRRVARRTIPTSARRAAIRASGGLLGSGTGRARAAAPKPERPAAQAPVTAPPARARPAPGGRCAGADRSTTRSSARCATSSTPAGTPPCGSIATSLRRHDTRRTWAPSSPAWPPNAAATRAWPGRSSARCRSRCGPATRPASSSAPACTPTPTPRLDAVRAAGGRPRRTSIDADGWLALLGSGVRPRRPRAGARALRRPRRGGR